ncbi:glycosyl hydrolase family 18 protein [Rhodanobacter sp. A1T4]|jgi:spore germination protein YaaH|uniref:glycosyl hydrolase family 18 protein n=1 Tax=Rhodanobacter sp. A1T4 TaxID=2723087 RepID=UPI00161E75C8|nr:glycosyl hydrolase family 18 protein [Rhodanobacter sp. A1T4]MBB6245269.1 spore germination protein YaaH [Rhodanobacter sp. A1T4]
MKSAFRCLLAVGLFCTLCVDAVAAPKSLFYMVESPKSVRSFLAHADKIDILVPTWYGVDAKGLVQGTPDATVMQQARSKGVELMPIISANAGKAGFHALLGDADARQALIAALIRIGHQEGYSGFQFDFEDIDYTDRDALTRLASETAAALHRAGLKLSIAVVPNAPGYFTGSTAFGTWMWSEWRGVFDVPALAKVMDLICLMTYDQNTRWTTPGPVDGMPWVQKQLDYALKYVPKNKLSLGIPLYGYHWYAGDPVDAGTGKERPNISGDYIDYDESLPLAQAHQADIQWDAYEHESWYYFYRDDLREWVFMPDARSFKERYALVGKDDLQGFCSWVLGAEDPAIWDELPVVHH